jgi:hypothetical protein
VRRADEPVFAVLCACVLAAGEQAVARSNATSSTTSTSAPMINARVREAERPWLMTARD